MEENKKYSIITVTGPDRCGKATQSYLLSKAINNSKLMSTPDYTTWSGKIIRSILYGIPFSLAEGPPLFNKPGVFQQTKEPELFQLLQTINRLERKDEILEGLKSHHWIMDRWDADALAYGMIDGCKKDLLLTLLDITPRSDLVIVLTGKPYPTPGKVLDMNEADMEFQSKVAERFRYWSTSKFRPFRIIMVNTDEFSNPEIPHHSISRIHNHICGIVEKEIGLLNNPLSEAQVIDSLKDWKSY